MRAAILAALLGLAPGLLDPFTPVKAGLVRLVGLPMLALAGLDLVLRPSGGRFTVADRSLPGMADRAVVGFLLAATASTWLGASPRLSVLGEISQREGLLTVLALAGVWFAARRSHGDERSIRHTLIVVVLGAAAVAGYALLQLAGADPLQWARVHRYAGAVRPASTLGNSILFGAVMGPAAAVLLTSFMRERVSAWWSVPALAGIGFAAVASLSRGAWLALGSALALGAIVALRDGAGAARRGWLGRVALAAAPAVVYVAVLARPATLERLGEAARSGTVSTPGRLEMWRGALELWRTRPWLGTGPDTFGLLYPRVQSAELWRAEWVGIPAHAHSSVLQLLATLGLLGVGLVLLVGVGLVRRSRERSIEATAARAAIAALVAAGLFNPLGIAGAVLLAVLAGLALPSPASGPAGRGRTSGVAMAVAVMVAAIVAVPLATELRALHHAGRARGVLEAIADGELPGDAAAFGMAAEAAGRATALMPGEDELARLACDAWLGRANATGAPEARIHVEAAVRHALAAVTLEPLRASNLQRLANGRALEARLALAAGDTSTGRHRMLAADSGFTAAARLAPSDALILVDRARAELELGRPAEAQATAARIVALYPEAATGHTIEASAWIVAGDAERAIAALRRALAARWESEGERRNAEAVLAQLEALRR